VALAGRLRALANTLGCTTFMLGAALLATTLARRSAQRDFLFAFPWAGREAPGSEHAVGMFVNTLVLRVDLTGAPTWRELLARVREHSMSCYRNADVAFDAVAGALHPERDLSRPPLTPVYLSAQDGRPNPPSPHQGVATRYLPLDPLLIKYELELVLTEQAGDLELAASYAVGLFDDDTIAGLLDAMVAHAVDLAADPDAHPVEGI
jgi:non-ribosomal peptide synthetase component F